MFDNATKIEEPIDKIDKTDTESETEHENAAAVLQNSQTAIKILNFGEPSNQDESEENQDQCIEMKVITKPATTRSTTLTLEQILNEPSTSRGPLSHGHCTRDELLISLTKRLSKVMSPDDLNRELRRVTSFTCHPMLSSTFSDHNIAGPSHANEDYLKPIIPSSMANEQVFLTNILLNQFILVKKAIIFKFSILFEFFNLKDVDLCGFFKYAVFLKDFK